jgi:hypothetical protein
MNKPQLKAVVFFVGILGVGFALAIPLATGLFGSPFIPLVFVNITAFAFLFAVVMTLLLDKPLELELFKWPEKKPEAEKPQPATIPAPAQQAQAAAPAEIPQQPAWPMFPSPSTSLFPHETPTEHWDADFGDSKQVYQGSDLPVWILAGWAVFIIWAVIYLLAGLPTAF